MENPGAGRPVTWEEYQRVVAERRAVRDPAVGKPGGIGEVERWLTPEGAVCAYLVVRYWKGEHDYDYFIVD